MLIDIAQVEPIGDYRLNIQFEDGVAGKIDVEKIIEFKGVFAPLKDKAFFTQVQVNSEWGTIFWPNGADLDPDLLYSEITGQPLPAFEKQPAE
ncbi:MAG: DUF2442 domain-containing protein [Anaerolineales bacterium]|jgi:hypothetical protein